MSFLEATLEALKGFADEVATWTNQGSLVSIEGHIAQIENAAAEDLHAGETAAKAVWADLYAAFHGHHAAPAAAAEIEPPAVTEAPAGSAAADPTPAPSTTTEGSSAPSSTPSASTTDTPAA